MICLSVAGCTMSRLYGGAPLPAEQVERLRRNMSKVEVLELLGPPDSLGRRLQGSVFIYRYRTGNNLGVEMSLGSTEFEYLSIDRKTDRLVVFFDKQGLVTDFATHGAPPGSVAP